MGTASTPGANYLPNGTPNIFLEVVSPGIDRCEFSDSGNTFTVDDFSFVTMIAQLQARIADLAGNGELTSQVASKLDGLLDTASEYLAKDATQGACRSLAQVRTVVHRSHLRGLVSFDVAQELRTSAEGIQDALSW